jgi:hypothetical protein
MRKSCGDLLLVPLRRLLSRIRILPLQRDSVRYNRRALPFRRLRPQRGLLIDPKSDPFDPLTMDSSIPCAEALPLAVEVPIKSIRRADNYIDDLVVVVYANSTTSVAATASAFELVRRRQNNPGMNSRHPSTPPISAGRQAQAVVGTHPQNGHLQVFER